MIFIARDDKSYISKYWWSIDHWNLLQILILAFVGSIMILAAGSAVAEKHNFEELYFSKHHIYYLHFEILQLLQHHNLTVFELLSCNHIF